MDCEERPQVDEGKFRYDFKGLMPIDRLDDACDVMHISAEGLTGTSVNASTDQSMYLIYVLNRLSIDPNNRYHVEESPPLGEGLRRNEDSSPHSSHQFLDNSIIDLKRASIMFFEVDIDTLEEL